MGKGLRVVALCLTKASHIGVVGTTEYKSLKSKSVLHVTEWLHFLLNMMIKKRHWKLKGYEWSECDFLVFFLFLFFFLVHVLAYATGEARTRERG